MKRPRNSLKHRFRRAFAVAVERIGECFARARRPVVIVAVYGMTNPAISTNAVRAPRTN